MPSLKIGICGATGAVGTTIISVLSRRNFPVYHAPSGVCIRCFASKNSVGKTIGTPYGDMVIQEFTVDEARAMDIVFLAVSKEFALHYAPLIAAAPGGAIVIDNSSAFRYEVEYPLCIPEINPEVVALGSRIIANPNCTTAIAAVVLFPLHQKYKLNKIIVSSYQASSGAGVDGMEELKNGVKQVLAGNACPRNVFPHPLAFNVIPHIDTILDNGYTKEEMKVVWETRKIFGMKEDVKISATAVRVPTLRAHALTLTVETEETVDPGEARELLRTCAGVQVVDDPKKLEYPTPVNASTKFDVQVGRIRQSLIFGEHGLDLFVCGDQLLKGAALNAVQIAEIIS